MKIETNYEDLKSLVYFDIRGELSIGKNVNIEPFASILCYHKINIGSGTQIATGVRIVDFEHDFTNPQDIHNIGKLESVFIGNNCMIGANAVILKGVTLGDGCIVGAGAIVTKSFPDGSVIVGNPARLLRTR